MRRRFMSSKVSFEPFYIEAIEDGVSYSIGVDTKYKIDNGDWIFLQKNENSPSINIGSKLYIKSEKRDVVSFNITNGCRIGGDIRSLSYGDKFLTTKGLKYNYQFTNLFYGCVSIREVDENLLKFTELTNNCYTSMFSGCTSLVNAPELPATTLTKNCYMGMFHGCINLNYIKMLATDISAINCLSDWVKYVSSTGTFVKNKDATWDVRGASGIPEGWTVKTDDEESGGNSLFPATLIPTREENLPNYNIAKYFVDNYPDMVVDYKGRYSPISEDVTIQGSNDCDGKVIGVAKWVDGCSLLFYTENGIANMYALKVYLDENEGKGFAIEYFTD